MTDKTLSDSRYVDKDIKMAFYPEEKVKQAVKRLKDEIFHDNSFTDLEITIINSFIDKIMGKDLI